MHLSREFRETTFSNAKNGKTRELDGGVSAGNKTDSGCCQAALLRYESEPDICGTSHF
jgi:hypothetical protein